MKLTDMLRAKSKVPDESIAPFETQAEKIHIMGRDEIKSLPIDRIEPNPFQPRLKFDEEALQELANSIAEHGLLHPIIVREVENQFQLIAGERRLRACKLLGWRTIPAVIKQMDDRTAAEMALIENLQRRDLHFLEEAEGYERLIAEFKLTQEELAKRLGKSQSSIANRLRLLKLGKEIRAIISREMVTERHARALLRLNSEEEQMKVLQMIIEQGLSVRQTEQAIERLINQNQTTTQPKQNKKIILKDIRLFTNSMKQLTETLVNSGLDIDYHEEEDDECYRVTVTIKKPERRDQ